MRRFSLIDYLALFLFSFVVTVTVMTFIYPPTGRMDFGIYLLATKLALLHKPLYPLLYGGAPFTYPPSISLFFFPFIAVPFALATSVWNLLSLVALLASIFILLSLLHKPLKFSYIFLILSAVYLLEPVRETFLFGQNNILVLFFIVLSFFFSQRSSKKHDIVSGVSLGLAASLKVFPLFLLVYFLVKKKWLSILFTVMVFVFFLIAGTFGNLSYIQQYFHEVGMVMSPIRAIDSDQSFSSFLLFFFPSFHFIQPLITDGVYCLFLLCSFLLWKKRTRKILSDFLFFAYLLSGTILIITPLAWVHHLVFLIPLSLGLLLYSLQTKNITEIIFFSFAVILFFIGGEDSVLFFQQARIGYFPILYFHALIGLGVALIGEFLFALQSLQKEKA